MDKEIYIVRHGQTDYNKQKIVQGSGVDSSLNDTGRAQAKALFEAYGDVDFGVVFTSDLVRTHQTAKGFIDKGIPHVKDGNIDEISWGVHEGKSGEAGMKEDYTRLMAAWKNGDYGARIEGGESAQELADRLGKFVTQLKQRPEDKILVISHGRSIRCLMCLIEERPILHMDKYHHHNTGLYKVTQKGDKLKIVLSNSIDHLKEMNS